MCSEGRGIHTDYRQAWARILIAGHTNRGQIETTAQNMLEEIFKKLIPMVAEQQPEMKEVIDEIVAKRKAKDKQINELKNDLYSFLSRHCAKESIEKRYSPIEKTKKNIKKIMQKNAMTGEEIRTIERREIGKLLQY